MKITERKEKIYKKKLFYLYLMHVASLIVIINYLCILSLSYCFFLGGHFKFQGYKGRNLLKLLILSYVRVIIIKTVMAQFSTFV
jgi:hypothetical protein